MSVAGLYPWESAPTMRNMRPVTQNRDSGSECGCGGAGSHWRLGLQACILAGTPRIVDLGSGNLSWRDLNINFKTPGLRRNLQLTCPK